MRMQLMAVFALCFATGLAQAEDQYKNGQELTGTWRILATIPAGVPVCPGPDACTYQAMATAISDGTVVQTAAIPNTTVGHGAWKRVGHRTFKMVALYFRVDGQGLQVGTSETSIDAQVDTTGRNVTGLFSAVLRNMLGEETLQYSGTVTGRRIEVP